MAAEGGGAQGRKPVWKRGAETGGESTAQAVSGDPSGYQSGLVLSIETGVPSNP